MEFTCLQDQDPADKMFFQDTVFRIGYPNSTEVSPSEATASLTSSDVDSRLRGMSRAFSMMRGEAGTEKLFAGKYVSGGTLPVLLGEYILVV